MCKPSGVMLSKPSQKDVMIALTWGFHSSQSHGIKSRMMDARGFAERALGVSSYPISKTEISGDYFLSNPNTLTIT